MGRLSKKKILARNIGDTVAKIAEDGASGNRRESLLKRKCLREAPEQSQFILADGRRLKSLFELALALDEMHEHTYLHHVNEHRNDFANWVKDIFDEPALAEEIRPLHDRMASQRALLKHLVKELHHWGSAA